MAISTPITTRRAVIAGLALSAPFAGPFGEAIAATVTTPDRSAWDRAFAEMQRAKAASDAANAIAHQTYEAFKRIEPTDDTIQFREFTIFCGNPTEFERSHIKRVMDVEEEWQRFLSTEKVTWWARDPEKRKREYRAALDSVTDYRRRFAEAERVSGYAEACERSDQLDNEACEAGSRLILTPAPDLAALRWKAEHMFGDEAREPDESSPPWCAEWTDAFMADVRRLLSAEG